MRRNVLAWLLVALILLPPALVRAQEDGSGGGAPAAEALPVNAAAEPPAAEAAAAEPPAAESPAAERVNAEAPADGPAAAEPAEAESPGAEQVAAEPRSVEAAAADPGGSEPVTADPQGAGASGAEPGAGEPLAATRPAAEPAGSDAAGGDPVVASAPVLPVAQAEQVLRDSGVAAEPEPPAVTPEATPVPVPDPALPPVADPVSQAAPLPDPGAGDQANPPAGAPAAETAAIAPAPSSQQPELPVVTPNDTAASDSQVMSATSSAGSWLRGDHSYTVLSGAFPAGTTREEAQRALNSFNAPDRSTLTGAGRDPDAPTGLSVVTSASGIPGGVVRTERGVDASGVPFVRNTTTPLHAFQGSITRTLVQDPDGSYRVLTQGTGSGTIPLLDWGRQWANSQWGPGMFQQLDNNMLRNVNARRAQ